MSESATEPHSGLHAEAGRTSSKENSWTWSLVKNLITTLVGVVTLLVGSYASYLSARKLNAESKLADARSSAYSNYISVEAEYFANHNAANADAYRISYERAQVNLALFGDAEIVHDLAKVVRMQGAVTRACGAVDMQSIAFWQKLRTRNLHELESAGLRPDIAILVYSCIMHECTGRELI